MNYFYTIITLIAIYALLSESLNLIMGYGGMFHMGQGALFCIGAYVGALVTVHFRFPFIVEMLVAGVVSGIVGLVLSYPALRLRGDYLAFATYGVGIVIYAVANNWVELTNGPMGLPGVSRPTILGFYFSDNLAYMLLTLGVSILCLFIIYRIMHSPYGKTIEAIREDETGAFACGINVSRLRTEVFCVGSVFAGVAGVLFAHYLTIVDPASFTATVSSLIISMVVIGGRGSFWGAVLGAVIVLALPEALRFLDVSSFYREQIQNIVYSIILIMIILKRPQGLLGKLKF